MSPEGNRRRWPQESESSCAYLKRPWLGSLRFLVCFAGPRATSADVPSKEQSKPSSAPAGLAMLVQSVIDTVLEHHIDPPARQQMILTGVQALYKAAGAPVPHRLSNRVSCVTTPEQLARLLDDIWPASTSKSVPISELEEALLGGLLASVSGDAHLVPEKERKVQEQNDGNRYVGIHIALGVDEAEKRPSIAQVIEGGPADRAGVKSNDLVEQIEGVDTKGMPLRDAVDRLRGDEGTSVTIKVRQPGAGAVADLQHRAREAPASDDRRLAQAAGRQLGLPDE